MIADEFTTDVTKWAIADEGVYVYNPEFVEVKLDSENKIIWAIKTDGDIFYGAGVPTQVKEYIQGKIEELGLSNVTDIVTFLGTLFDDDKTLQELLDEKVNVEEGKALIDADVAENLEFIENSEYIELETDSEGKILGGRKADGTKFENVGNENPVCTEEYAKENRWLDITIDRDNKIIEGITQEGKKHISDFDDETKETIKSFAGSDEMCGNLIEIPQLDANFTSPIPVVRTGTKGAADAVYKFGLPLSETAFNIRFKFRIVENIFNQVKNAVIAQIGNAYIRLKPRAFTQLTSTYTYNSESKTSYYGSFVGGVHLNDGSITHRNYDRNVGALALSIRYTGEDEAATIENTGSAFVFKDGGNTTTFSFETYPTVYELYEALKATTNISVDFNEINHRNCTELCKFPETKLGSYYYSGTHGKKDDDPEEDVIEYFDNAPVYIPYAVDERWHQAEIVKMGDSVYVVCDGQMKTFSATSQTYNELTLGGGCGVLFKDFEVHTDSVWDFEIVDNIPISSCSPNFIIFEGHNMIDEPSGEVNVTSSTMGTTVDRLSYVFDYMKAKGYLPVSIYDIIDYYDRNASLPKRCFTIIMDDFRWQNCLNPRFRRVFEHYGVKPALAIISEYDETITLDGNTISIDKAAQICRMHDFDIVSHTRNHRYNLNIKPSDYMDEFTEDLYSCDARSVDGNVLVYPSGSIRTYMFDVLDWLGYRCGVFITGDTSLNKLFFSRYILIRTEIGLRNSIENIINSIK